MNFGVLSGSYNKTTKSYQQNPKLKFRVKQNYIMYIFWFLASVGIVIKYYLRHDVNRFNVTLAYVLTGLLVAILFSAFRFYVHDICIVVNGFSGFIKYMQSK